ncbi:DUF222 domain-containing protein, partial [Kineosporia sp. A_224]|uniref:DUF222 domain-containing protein n=1 Tax=Kineosporia sp. A_224 TaxID=1962180 RepID=UPI00117A0B7A
MVGRVRGNRSRPSDVVAGSGLDLLDGDLLVDPLGGRIHLSAEDLAGCPSDEDDTQRALADAHAERLADAWWADPVAAQADWDAQLAAVYALVAADDRRDAVGRRVVLDGDPGLGSLAAAMEVLDGAAAWTPTQAGVDGFVDVLQDAAVAAAAAGRRLENLMLWLQVAHTGTVLTARIGNTPSLPRKTRTGRVLNDDPDDQDAMVDDEVAVEVAVAAGITRSRASSLVEAAGALVIDGRLPLTAQALQHGRLDWPRLRLVLSRTRGLTAQAAQAVEALVYATCGVLDGGTRRFENALTAAVLAVDPDAEARRRERTRKGRRVSIQTGDDGEALFTAVGPGEAVAAAYNGLDAAARYLRQNGDPRTLDQLRHDLFVTGCTSGYLPVPAGVLPVPAGCVPTAGAATRSVSEPGLPDTFRNATRATGSSGSRTADATTRTSGASRTSEDTSTGTSDDTGT